MRAYDRPERDRQNREIEERRRKDREVRLEKAREGLYVDLYGRREELLDYEDGLEEWAAQMNRDLEEPKVKVSRLKYDRSNLLKAYEATQHGMSVCKAAKLYCVPESTLRDRTRGNVSIDAKPGVSTLFTISEENELVNHMKYMASIGYGYNKSEVQYMARDFAVSLGKDVKSSHIMSNSWFYDFLSRWPELKRVMPQKLSIARAKSASKEKLDAYFKELGTIITNNNLSSHPECIYNIDETGVSTEHTPAKIVCSKESIAQSVTSPKSSNVTIIAGGNALGNFSPPYYVFPGKRWNNDFLKGAPAGSDGEVSDNGWSNSSVFSNYLTKHFSKFVKFTPEKDGQKVLILYDGHKSHIQLTLANWAKRNNIILFVLPPHTSHITQPLDIGIFGPFKAMYNHECHAFMRKNPGLTVSKYNLAELTANPYIKALRSENLVSAFKKAGVFPFNSKAVTPDQVAPAVIYQSSTSVISDHQPSVSDIQETQMESSSTVLEPHSVNSEVKVRSFFEDRTVTNVVIKPRQKRVFVPPFIAGNLLKKSNVKILEGVAAKKSKHEQKYTKKVTKSEIVSKKSKSKKQQNKKLLTSDKPHDKLVPVASTTGLNKGGKPIDLCSEVESGTESSIAEEELCCVCHGWQPEELRGCDTICFVTWGKCDFCEHWTHLKYCTEIRVLRRDSVFRCPHCPTQEE